MILFFMDIHDAASFAAYIFLPVEAFRNGWDRRDSLRFSEDRVLRELYPNFHLAAMGYDALLEYCVYWSCRSARDIRDYLIE